MRGAVASLFRSNPHASPSQPLHVHVPNPGELSSKSESGLRTTWLGHSTLLLEIEGTRVLTDPVWSDRTSPLPWIGPRRFFVPPLPLDALPIPHIVALSHDHYDHLDKATLRRMRHWDTRFLVPLGLGSYLRAWGIDPARITEMDWWDRVEIGAYNQAWPDWHMGPEQAVEAARRVKSRALLPIHWGTFKLASHG